MNKETGKETPAISKVSGANTIAHQISQHGISSKNLSCISKPIIKGPYLEMDKFKSLWQLPETSSAYEESS